MIKSILLILLLIFIVSGICEFIFLFKILFFFPGKRFNAYTLIELEKGFAIRQLEFYWQKILWYGEAYSNGIIAIYDKIDEDEFFACISYIKNKNIILRKKDEILRCLKKQGDFFDDKC